jgi:two-component system chemotaxis response regulator CheB
MVKTERIKVLIVDDSIVFREVLKEAIALKDCLEVVATANDPYDARDKIIKYHPDVMVCDVQMPRMNGVEFIKRLLPQYHIPVIVISSINEMVFEALEYGAVDFLQKPRINSVEDVEHFFNEITYKIMIAAKANLTIDNTKNNGYAQCYDGYDLGKVIAIGASTGGTDALYQILRKLSSNMPGIVVVQHIPPVFSEMFAQRLNNQTNLRVKEAETGDYLDKGVVLIAPGDKHIKIRRIGDRYRVECFAGDKVSGHCPSVDVLFQSVAKEAGKNAIGILLTGMGSDGAQGLLEIKQHNGYTIAQDASSSVVYGMPKAAYNLGAVTKQLTLKDIPKELHEILKIE